MKSTIKKFGSVTLIIAALIVLFSIPSGVQAIQGVYWEHYDSITHSPFDNDQILIGRSSTTTRQRLEVYNDNSTGEIIGGALYQDAVAPKGVDFVNWTEDSTLLSTFSGGENPQYDVFSYVNLGSFKVFSPIPYQTGAEVGAQTYSEVFTWDAVPGADGYRIFRDRNATGDFVEYGDVVGGGTVSSSFTDSDYSPHVQSIVWESSTEAVSAVPTSYDLQSFFNWSNKTNTFGFGSLGGAYFGNYVGIGTSSPFTALSVVGTITTSNINATSTATSTFAGAIKAGDYYSSNGTRGFTGTCTILGLTSITVKNGLITSCQ